MVFEGTEKKIEIVVQKSIFSLRHRTQQWERVVAKAGAIILSKISNPVFDAYIISESSLFVFENRVILITCGVTQLILAIKEMLSFIPREAIALLMYERKNEFYPKVQRTSFNEDVAVLKKYLPGDAYCFQGKNDNKIYLFHYHNRSFQVSPKDMTLEILMSGLPPFVEKYFNQTCSKKTIYSKTGVDSILTGFTCDDFVFSPMGYSINAIRNDEYYTCHVSIEPSYSYASFETNCYFENEPIPVIEKVLNIFKPLKFLLLLFDYNGIPIDVPCDYLLREKKKIESCGFHIQFGDYEKRSSKGQGGKILHGDN